MNKLVLVTVTLLFSVFAFSHEGEEENSAVGPEKGITAANEADGFKLAPEAIKKLGIKSVAFAGVTSFKHPKAGIFFGLQEQNLFRVRNGFFKRIDFNVISKTNSEWTISSSELKSGDQIATEGIGFLRIVELQATGGISDEH